VPGSPRIKSVTATGNWQLVTCFENGVEKTYDCGPLLARPKFCLLKVPAFFLAVKVDAGGYGVSWNDSLDLSEYELWTNGMPAGNQELKRTRQAPR